MIFGDCPHCNEPVTAPLAQNIPLPIIQKLDCEHCKKPYYLYHSRLDPKAYTEEQLETDFEIDHENKILRKR